MKHCLAIITLFLTSINVIKIYNPNFNQARCCALVLCLLTNFFSIKRFVCRFWISFLRGQYYMAACSVQGNPVIIAISSLGSPQVAEFVCSSGHVTLAGKICLPKLQLVHQNAQLPLVSKKLYRHCLSHLWNLEQDEVPFLFNKLGY